MLVTSRAAAGEWCCCSGGVGLVCFSSKLVAGVTCGRTALDDWLVGVGREFRDGVCKRSGFAVVLGSAGGGVSANPREPGAYQVCVRPEGGVSGAENPKLA